MMLRLLRLELKKLAKPVLATLAILTIITCVLTATLYHDYIIYYPLDPWEIGTEFLGLLFPLVVTVPVCWQLYYERRNRFLTYTLPRVPKKRYLTVKWLACALSAFLLLFIPYLLAALGALFVNETALQPPHGGYGHVFYSLYSQTPLVYALLLSLWKSLLGVLVMTFGFVLALYSNNLFVILTAPFVYLILENFIWSVIGLPIYRFDTAFEPTSLANEYVKAASFAVGPLLLCTVIALVGLYFAKVKKRTVYPV